MTDQSLQTASNRAIVVFQTGPQAIISIEDIEIPKPSPDDLLIRLAYSGVCHGDVSLLYGEWSHLGFQLEESKIPGHEGVGYVEKVGSNVTDFVIGDRVGVKWIRSVCWNRETDHHTERPLVGNWPGSFQQYVTSPANYTTRIPAGIPDEEAGPLICAGVTMYRALQISRVTKSQWVVIFGAGGGLGHLGIQYAKVTGCRVVGIDSSPKKDLCVSLGVDYFIDFTLEPDMVERVLRITDGGASAVIVAVTSRKSYEQAAKMLGFGGSLVCVGLPTEAFDFPLQAKEFITKSCVVTGISASSLAQVQEALQFSAMHQIKPKVQIFSLDEAWEVFKMMREQKIIGRAVLDLR